MDIDAKAFIWELEFHWYYKLIFVVACTVLAIYVASYVISRLTRLPRTGPKSARLIIASAIKPPLYFFIIGVGISTLVQIIAVTVHWTAHLSALHNINLELFVVTLFWFTLRFINKMEYHWASRIKADPNPRLDHTSLGALVITAKIIFFLITALVVLDSSGISVSGILTFGGISGIIVGLASKDLLSNFFGAVTIYSDKAFKVGDWIRLPEKNIEGVVEKIGLRSTIVRTADKRPLHVPNSYFTQIPVENPARMSHRRIEENIPIRLEDSAMLEAIIKEISGLLDSHSDVDRTQTCLAYLSSINGSGLHISILCHTKTTALPEFLKIKEEILLAVLKIIEKHKAFLMSCQHL